MTKEITLYHGSHKIIRHPTPSAGKAYNDYGQGFYCTRHEKLAGEWAVDSRSDGYINRYRLDCSDLHILNLNQAGFSILHWLTILLEHRTPKLNTPVMSNGLDYLKRHYHINLINTDVVIGYRADDSYYSFARAFLANTISLEQLQDAMYLGELGEQYFIQSQLAFDHLSFEAVSYADHTLYYPERKGRDLRARACYDRILTNPNLKGTYLLDLMRKEELS